jgi:hypothetical protein
MINKLKKNIFKKSYFSLETFAENILYIIIGFLIILLLLSNRRANNYQDIISNVNLENQEFKSKSLKNGEKLYEQEQIILSQKEAIKNGLLELENLKKIESQVKIVTVTKIDTVLISHIDTVIRKIDGSDYLKLPQNYNFGNDFFNFDANIDVNGLFVNNINIYNETKINVGYKRDGFLKPLEPIVEIKNTNPYMNLTMMNNVVIEDKKGLFEDKKAWLGVGETDEQVGEIIADYWNRSGIYSNPDFTAQEVTQEDFQEQYPWSAVFISWIMNVSGAGNNFEYAPSHAEYILKFKENRINNQGKFKAYSIEEIKPKKSDLVCRWRQNEINYDSIQEGDLTHCDIVVDINNNGINVVGGNLDNKVKTLQLSTDNDGYVDEDKYFAIIRNEL